jgi:murein DD-endopeptidase MepM/ murein hydrolase activator NlpD
MTSEKITLPEQITQSGEMLRLGITDFPFGEVVRHGGEANPHGIDVTMPVDAFPIVSDYLSVFTTFGGSREKLTFKKHTGIDVGAPIGTPVLAAADGIVTARDSSEREGDRVYLRHENGVMSGYIHLEGKIARDGSVKRGEVIGTVGVTGGGASGKVPHLHFSVWDGNTYGDPNNLKSLEKDHINPHDWWYDGPGKITLFRPELDHSGKYDDRPDKLTFPLPGINDHAKF